ncbi:hypothetical protein LTR37_019783 [Vermiconidia calcicola]|uniref:Uncharacterized protein n=1 Tax=Vermiconidia calcicola TaxID=1690605 RepID=A0ACC3MED2_9PEZI|nr:hypothetical protein LTR37_019783 [Vermiconidia calcicola]
MAAVESPAHQQDSSFFDGEYTAQSVTVTLCSALAIYNALELLLLISTTFRSYRGLYFWSLLVASAGVLPYAIGFMIEYFQLTIPWAGQITSTVGWCTMVTGQSLVLYSRLGVVLGPTHHNILKAVKWMIIIDGIVFHVSTTVIMFGANNAGKNSGFVQAYKYIEKIQMTGFTIQEFIISGLYIWRIMDILKSSDWSRRGKRSMRELFGINILIFVMDIALLVMEYQNRRTIERALKQFIYSVKLKLEFSILNKLVSITTQTADGQTFATFDDAHAAADEQPLGNAVALPPFQSETEKPGFKGDATHVERASSFLSGTTYHGERLSAIDSPVLSTTADQHRRRRTLEEDLYAGACRHVAG